MSDVVVSNGLANEGAHSEGPRSRPPGLLGLQVTRCMFGGFLAAALWVLYQIGIGPISETCPSRTGLDNALARLAGEVGTVQDASFGRSSQGLS